MVGLEGAQVRSAGAEEDVLPAVVVQVSEVRTHSVHHRLEPVRVVIRVISGYLFGLFIRVYLFGLRTSSGPRRR